MLAEVMIFVPSVARFRMDYLDVRLERAQLASLALLGNEMLDPLLERELLENAGVYNVVLLRDSMRQLVLSSDVPAPISATYDMRDANALLLIRDAFACLFGLEGQVIRVIGQPVREGGLLIEVTMESGPLRAAMLDYGLNILILSLVISVITASLLFLAVRRIIVMPIKHVVGAMHSYAEHPEDARNIIDPTSDVRELREAEESLQSLQNQLTGALRQKERLAQVGSAVAKISHDLRNILTTAQLFADRVEASTDPGVQRVVPKLLNSMSRAVALCESTLAFGKAEDPPPSLAWIDLTRVVDDVFESERIAAEGAGIAFELAVPPGFELRADAEQLYRVLTNLVRNGRQAIAATGRPGGITVRADDGEEAWSIVITDTGPGLPKKAQQHLFQPFQGGTRKGGTGLGLAISQDLVRGHGGTLDLVRSDDSGTEFVIVLPKGTLAVTDSAA
ncbi:MAG: HAMP domain-containing sensor histidine kinase [Pseudomonadota bacterium]